MAEEKFDAIIVGGGIAGTIASYLLAKEGLEVLLVERGNFAGSKNVSGGRIYSHSLEKIFPNFAQEAPVERKIVREKISLMTESSSVTLDFYSDALGKQGSDAYSVLRSVFDQWLAEKAEEAGVQIITGIRVDDLIMRDGKVCGVIAGGDELEANVTILADGVNSTLAQKIGLRGELAPNQVSVGAKEVIELPGNVINDRFNCRDGEGSSWLFAGVPSGGRIGGGFLYTNKESISMGIVCTLSDLVNSEKTVPQLLEDFKQHPIIEPLIKGGKIVEYSGHLVPEGGLEMVPKLVGDGVLVVGDAAGFCINVGYAVRGMDLAVTSAECAAKAVLAAKEEQDYSEASLNAYRANLDGSYLMKDLHLFKKLPHFMENTPRIFNGYPQMVADILNDMFVVSGQPATPPMKTAFKHVRKIGITNLIMDGLRGARSI
ncbi:putative oxidoreductase subunit with FAD/NAD(P)-binding domain [uncultured Sporomusa sp.]|uniref:Putative oxidoreductase subunit with FAD/NAD(P)-binding domain n=1 Tax=uncultured Sporomusa sp. TaxID=307249 RepID=A0A212LWQ4_9FIRM|nr:FAD-dependent oxidoreductase [uncultured Sporomusa sp.]SCM81910.1 putative oxidoreductase subunit with FAD/NAD(P)-binding domain [uncultured Sporomusa sp.]